MSRRSPRGAQDFPVSRRDFLRYSSAAGAVVGSSAVLPPLDRVLGNPSPEVLWGSDGPIDLTIAETPIQFGGRGGTAVTINGTVPGPLLRFRLGDEAVIRVHNTLDEDTSIHWHGILLPNGMDGVPKVNFPGIPPGETFEYRYPIEQTGTYWYHSHSGLQEQLGHYGAYVIDPVTSEPEPFDRDYTVILSDWTFESPYKLLAKLKKQPDYYNRQQRTLFDFFRDVGDRGLGGAISDRTGWGRMRMNPTDISDVTGATYTYLMNGADSETNWTGLFDPGERVRLRFINAGAGSYFDVRIPGLQMRVVQVSGQDVKPVVVDEIRMAIAETYDVIVEPKDSRAYTVYAEAMDRSGFVRGTLAPSAGMEADVPERRERALLTMADMGMLHGEGDDMAGHDMSAMEPAASVADTSAAADHEGHDMSAMEPAVSPADTSAAAEHEGHDMSAMAMPMAAEGVGWVPGMLPPDAPHSPDTHGRGNAGVAMVATSRLDEPGTGLGEDGRRVLLYSDLESLVPIEDFGPPQREIELHLTGNMERFMWSIDGVKFSDAEPIQVTQGERFRLTLVNDTMMNHPMHLHGMWMELENGRGTNIPRIHTLNMKPAEKASFLVTADAPGPWAFHCHILYHMDAGMFRVFHVAEADPHAGHVGEAST